jgi:hypothetical protein
MFGNLSGDHAAVIDNHALAEMRAHALRDHAAREQHFQQVLAHQDMGRVAQKLELRDAAYLNAVRWALHDRDNATAQHSNRDCFYARIHDAIVS